MAKKTIGKIPRRKLRKKIKVNDLQIRDTKISFKFIMGVILIILMVLFFLEILLDTPEKAGEKAEEVSKGTGAFFSSDGSTRVTMFLPAVNVEGEGVSTVLRVEVAPGSGRTLTEIDNLLFWADTQHSIRTARRVAENITGKKEENYDIVYVVEANASLIGGPSAGSALALATIAALEGRKLNEKVMITGSINHDGSIGPVSAVLEKAKAAKNIGAELFLVPLLQSRDVVYELSEHCEFFGPAEICTTETKPRKIEVQEEAGIKVIEVETVEDAMKYFFD